MDRRLVTLSLIVLLAVAVTVLSVTPNCTDVKSDCPYWYAYGLCMAWPILPSTYCPRSCNSSFHCPDDWPTPDLIPDCPQMFMDGLGSRPDVQQQCPTTYSLVQSAGECPPFPDPGFPHTTKSTNRTTPYSRVEFKCNRGYENLGGTRVFEHTCNFSAMWQINFYAKYRDPPNCQPVCDDIKSGCPTNTTVDECYFSPEDTWVICAQRCQTPVLCNSSLGDQSVDCGQWAKEGQCENSGSLAQSQCSYTCSLRSEVSCPEPPEVPGAVVLGGRRYMETIWYQCTGDSSAVGGLHVCSSNGTWIRASNASGEELFCPTTIAISSTSSDVLPSSSFVIETTTVMETSSVSSSQVVSSVDTTSAVQPSSTADVSFSSAEGLTSTTSSPLQETTPTVMSSVDETSSFVLQTSPQTSTEQTSPSVSTFQAGMTSYDSQTSPSEATTQFLQPSSTMSTFQAGMTSYDSQTSPSEAMTHILQPSTTVSTFQAGMTSSDSQTSPSEATTHFLQPSSTETVNSVTQIASTEDTTHSLQPSPTETLDSVAQTPQTTDSMSSISATASNETVNSTTSPIACGCRCSVIHNASLIQSTVQEIRENLTLDKTLLSMYRRRYVSMPDDRISAKSTGAVGVIIIISTVLMIVIPDVLKVTAFIAERFTAVKNPVGRVSPSP